MSSTKAKVTTSTHSPAETNSLRRISSSKSNTLLSKKFTITKFQTFSLNNKEYASQDIFSIIVDSIGNVWATVYNNNEVIKISFDEADRPFVKSFVFESFPQRPLGIALHPHDRGDVYISSQEGGTVHRLDTASGEVELVLSGLDKARGIAFDSQDNLYVTKYGGNHLRKYDKVSRRSQRHSTTSTPPPSLDTTFSDYQFVWTVLVNPRKESEVLLSYYGSNLLLKAVNGVAVQKWTEAPTTAAASAASVKQQASTAAAAATEPFGNLNGMCIYQNHVFVTDRPNGCIRVVDLGTGEVETLDIRLEHAGRQEVYCVAVDPVNKYLYVSSIGKIHRLHFRFMDNTMVFKSFPARYPGDVTVQYFSSV